VNNKILVRNFSKNAATYDEYASVQKKCAVKLLEYLDENSSCENILEIGCGTGIFTKLLSRAYPEAKITAIDISETMIKEARRRIPRGRIRFREKAIEDLEITEDFDIAASNVSLHWTEDFYSVIKIVKEYLVGGGEIAVSVYGPGTFKELKTVLSELYGPRRWLSSSFFLSADELLNNMKKIFKNVKMEEYNYEILYPDIWSFFYSVKKTGTRGEGLNGYIRLTKKRILDIQQRYFELYGEIKVTHNVCFLRGVKK
jgi:malonyl-CoA O-methyltransferase